MRGALVIAMAHIGVSRRRIPGRKAISSEVSVMLLLVITIVLAILIYLLALAVL